MHAHQTLDPDRSLKDSVASASEISADLIYRIISGTLPPHPDERSLPIYRKLLDFIRHDAWLDVAQCLMELRLPRWRIHQVYCEDGHWTCVLCLKWSPGEWPSAVCAGEHMAFELAIISAYLEAVERGAELERPLANVVPIRPPRAATPIAIYSKTK
jgi:hypothetical protein